MQTPRHFCKVRHLINSKANTRIAQPGFISVVCYVSYRCCLGPMRPERIPLSPLNVVLLPGAEMPLHIFEPRYRQMVKDCLKEKSEFGMLLSLPKGVARVGCTAEILDVVKRYEDGRMDITTAGRAPFRVVELFTEEPLLEGHVDYLEDRETPANPRIQRELVELCEACHTLIFDVYPKNLQGAAPEGLS